MSDGMGSSEWANDRARTGDTVTPDELAEALRVAAADKRAELLSTDRQALYEAADELLRLQADNERQRAYLEDIANNAKTARWCRGAAKAALRGDSVDMHRPHVGPAT